MKEYHAIATTGYERLASKTKMTVSILLSLHVAEWSEEENLKRKKREKKYMYGLGNLNVSGIITLMPERQFHISVWHNSL